MKYRLIYLLVLALFTAGCLAAQKSGLYSFNNIGFIENSDSRGSQSTSAPYRTEINGLRVDFTTEGLKYSVHGSLRTKKEEEKSALPDEGTHEIITFQESFAVLFVNPSDSLSIEALDLQSNYFVEELTIKQRCYNRVMYRDVWPNIDIEFTMPDKGGIKYNIYLEPGADVDDIKLDYSAANELDLIEGNLHVYSGLGKWVEYAPFSFTTESQTIASNYELDDGILSFSLATNEITEPTVIDPWIALIPAITSYDSLPDPADSLWVSDFGDLIGTGLDNAFNRVQIDYDAEGNIYLSQIACLFYESPDGFDDFYAVGRYIHKFNPQGELIFTVEHGNEFAICTDITVNKTSQNFYSSSLFSNLMYMSADGTTTDVFPIDDLPESIGELISMQYDHCQDKLILGLGADNLELGSFIATTGPSFTGELDYSFAYDISLSAPNALPFNDNIDVIIDPYGGDYFMLFLLRTGGFIEDRAMLRADPVNVDQIWQTNGEYLNLAELAMHSVGIIGGNLGRMHYESLACGKSSVYGTNGGEVIRWDKASGAVQNSIVLNFQNSGRSEGIDTDMCGNLYVGGNNEIRVLDSLLNPLTTIPLSGMPQDIHVFGNKLYVAEDFNLESIDIPESLSPWQFSQEPDSCNLCVGEASIEFCGELDSLNNISVEWVSNGETGFSTSGLCAGWNQIKIFEEKGCYTNVYMDSVLVDGFEGTDCGFQLAIDDETICLGECATLEANVTGQNGDLTIEWEHDGSLTDLSIEVCPDSTTEYIVNITDDTGETYSDTANVVVIPVSELNLGNDTTLCSGEELVLSPDIEDAAITWQDGSTEPTYLISEPGAYAAEVDFGETCIATDTISVAYSGLELDIGNDTTLCSLTNFELDAGPNATSYTWQDGSTSQFFSPESPGTYSVSVSDGFCNLQDQISIQLSEPEAAFAIQDSLNCEIQPVQFTDESFSANSTIVSWSWDFGDNSPLASGQNPVYEYASTGMYEVELTVLDEFGCEETAVQSFEINTYPSPEPFFSVDPPTPVTFEEVQFIDESGNALTWEWSFGDGSESSLQNPEHSYEVPGRYGVELVVTNEFCSESVTRFLNVGEELFIYVPNAFTPNEDGINDLFGPVISGGDVMDFEMLIFNRWGELIFETMDISEKWNGAHRESNSESASRYYVQNGVYVWHITVKENGSAEKQKLTGTVTLFR